MDARHAPLRTARAEVTRGLRSLLLGYVVLGFIATMMVGANVWVAGLSARSAATAASEDQVWSAVHTSLATIGALVGDVAQPPNAIFVSHDLATETANLDRAVFAIYACLRDVRAVMRRSLTPADRDAIEIPAARVESAASRLTADARQVLAAIRAGDTPRALERMAAIDAQSAAVNSAVGRLQAAALARQGILLGERNSEIARINRSANLLAGVSSLLAVLMILWGIGRIRAYRAASDAVAQQAEQLRTSESLPHSPCAARTKASGTGCAKATSCTSRIACANCLELEATRTCRAARPSTRWCIRTISRQPWQADERTCRGGLRTPTRSGCAPGRAAIAGS